MLQETNVLKNLKKIFFELNDLERDWFFSM